MITRFGKTITQEKSLRQIKELKIVSVQAFYIGETE